jgi:aminoglycoside phosphotransferase (APT) family kinase protein
VEGLYPDLHIASSAAFGCNLPGFPPQLILPSRFTARGYMLGPAPVSASIKSWLHWAPAGWGGYRARDTRLKRDIALKILPDSFATDPDRLARFQREAEVLASLNHPNIAHIYGIEESNDTRALVMELVEGDTLADRIGRGPIAVDEALPIAKQIAEALEAAHEQGIIHRDLKPANIKVRADGNWTEELKRLVTTQ